MKLLYERYAKREITKEQFEQMKRYRKIVLREKNKLMDQPMLDIPFPFNPNPDDDEE